MTTAARTITKPLTGWLCINCVHDGIGMWQPGDVEQPALTCCSNPTLVRLRILVPEPNWMRLRRERNEGAAA